jgi:hypothetical protein
VVYESIPIDRLSFKYQYLSARDQSNVSFTQKTAHNKMYKWSVFFYPRQRNFNGSPAYRCAIYRWADIVGIGAYYGMDFGTYYVSNGVALEPLFKGYGIIEQAVGLEHLSRTGLELRPIFRLLETNIRNI